METFNKFSTDPQRRKDDIISDIIAVVIMIVITVICSIVYWKIL